MATKEYELTADVYHETTSKPGEPFTFKTHERGAKIKLDDEQARRLIDAGAVKDPSDKGGETTPPTDEKPEARRKRTQTTAPKGEAPEGIEPVGTGSTATAGTAGPGDGQGAADNPPSAGRKS